MSGALIRVATDERVVITGANGTGKTTFVKLTLIPAVPAGHAIVIIDPKRDKAWRDVPEIKRNIMGGFDLKPGIWAFRFPEIKEGDDGSGENLARDPNFNRFLRAVWKHKNVLLVIDETSALFSAPHTMTALMGRLIREGRARNIGLWWLVQRPASIPQSILTEAESWAVFTLRRLLDRKTAAAFMGDEVEERLPQEPGRSHYFWWCRPGMARPQQLRLRLVKGAAA